jgi:hypothetical protein
MALTLKVGEVTPGASYCTRDRDAAPFRPAMAVLKRVPTQRTLERLADDQVIRPMQLRAGIEIRGYWRVWLSAFSVRISSYGAQRFGEQPLVIPLPLRAMVARYRDWAKAAEARVVRGEATALAMTLDLCLDDVAPRELRERYRLRRETALRVVQESLHDYARRAGWLTEREAA